MKKISLVLSFVLLFAVIFAVSALAADFTVSVDDIESMTSSAAAEECWGSMGAMFDGNIECAGGWYIGNGWACPAGQSGTIVFKETLKIKSITFYGWSNWNSMEIHFYDENNQEVASYNGGGYSCTDGSPTDLKVADVSVKSFTIKTTSSKGLRNMTYTEFVIVAEEPHTCSFETLQSTTTPATCAVAGEGVYACECGLTQTKPIPATGEHNYSEFVAYVEGKEPTCAVAGEATYKCATCDGTQVKDVEATGNHSYTEFVAYVEGKEPTCGAAGEATYKCATCDGTEVKPVDATGDHKYTEFVGVKYPNGFLAEGVKEYACVCEATTSEAAPAIFEFLGYSVKEDESAICAGYTVNREALELYEEMNNTTVKFGVVAAGYDNLVNADGKPINADGTTAEVTKGAVITVGFENDIYTSFAIRMVADDWTAVADAKIILGAYVIDGDVVSYICSDVATEAAAPITYNSINGGNN